MGTIRTTKSYIMENLLIPKNARLTISNARKIKEKVSFGELKDLLGISKGNENLDFFYKERNRLNGQGNRNIKYVTTQFDPNSGAMSILFRTDATFNDTDKQEVLNQNENDGTLVDNIADEYSLEFKICDFTELLMELAIAGESNFTKEDMGAIIELSNEIRLDCNCPSSYWMGGNYYLTKMDAQIKDCTIAPHFWNRADLRPDVPFCKHLTSLVQHINFFVPQMAQGAKTELMRYGLIG